MIPLLSYTLSLTSLGVPHLWIPFLTGGGSHGHSEPFNLLSYIFDSNIINITIVAVFLYWVIQKLNLSGKVGDKSNAISQELTQVEKRREEAKLQLEEIQTRIAGLQDEVEVILQQARDSADAMSKQMLVDAQSEASRIVENAKKRISTEQRSAAKTLQAKLLQDALDDVVKKLSDSMTAEDHQRAIDVFVEELPKVTLQSSSTKAS